MEYEVHHMELDYMVIRSSKSPKVKSAAKPIKNPMFAIINSKSHGHPRSALLNRLTNSGTYKGK